MADDIRIKDLQSTASYMESDDYLPIDSLALGNRKIPFTGLMDSEDDRLPTTDKTLRGAINEHEGDISEIKQSLSNLLFQGAGKVTNLNLPDRTKGVIYINTYDAGATNAPSSSNGGYLFTFVNTDSANYGIQVSVTNGGIHARRLQGGNYQTWVLVVSV